MVRYPHEITLKKVTAQTADAGGNITPSITEKCFKCRVEVEQSSSIDFIQAIEVFLSKNAIPSDYDIMQNTTLVFEGKEYKITAAFRYQTHILINAAR